MCVEMAVAVRVLLAALLGFYWSSSRVEGNYRKLHLDTTISYITHMHIRIYASPFVLHKSMLVDLCMSNEAKNELCEGFTSFQV